MDENVGTAERDVNQFQTEEAIAAVADNGFMGEDGDQYEDLYNDVNVGDGFFQSLQRNDDLGLQNEEREDKKVESVAGQGENKMSVIPSGIGVERKSAVVDEKGLVEENVANNFNAGVSRSPSKFGGSLPDMGMGRIEGVGLKGPGVGSRVHLGQNSSAVLSNHGELIRNESFTRQGRAGNSNVGSSSGGGTILFVRDLHWWTTDAELESELCRYGDVKELKFFEEKASGKSKGYCQVEFYDPAAAMACKEGMNGHVFNGQPCVVVFASPYSVRKMGEAQGNMSQAMGQTMSQSQGRRGMGEQEGRGNGFGRRGMGDQEGRGSGFGTGANYRGGDGGRNFGKMGGWGRSGGYGGQGMGNRGGIRNKVGMGGRGIIGSGGGGGVGGGLLGSGLALSPLVHPQTMIGQGFDPTYGAHMGRLGGYGGFSTPTFSGILPSFPQVGPVGLPGVAPHVNPAFFGRGVPINGMGIMPAMGVEGPTVGMWADPNVSGWGGDEHSSRTGDLSYGEDVASDHQYGEMSHERGGISNSMKEKDMVSNRDWPGGYEQRYRDDRESGWERKDPREKDVGSKLERRHRNDRELGRDSDRYRDERDRYADHQRHRDRDVENDDGWDRERPSRTHNRPRLLHEEGTRSRSRDLDYGKRRRLPYE